MDDTFQPSGFDRADGLDGRPGTPTPPNLVVNKPSSTIFEEPPPSPEIERGEQGTFVHTLRCDAATGLTIVQGLPRGSIMVDSYGVSTKVLTTRYQQAAGNTCVITVTAEALTLDVPPDEFNVEAVEFNPSLFRHPRYAGVINYNQDTSGNPVDTTYSTGSQIIARIQGAINLPQVASQAEASALLTAAQINPSATDTNGYSILNLARELLVYIQQGFDTFYLAGYRITYSYYDFLPIEMNPGGYIQDPVASGALPYYFWSADGSPTGPNILMVLAASVAPQFYGGGFSWLRQSDYQTYQRTWFKITQTWVGGPLGQWNAIIYGHNPGPPAG